MQNILFLRWNSRNMTSISLQQNFTLFSKLTWTNAKKFFTALCRLTLLSRDKEFNLVWTLIFYSKSLTWTSYCQNINSTKWKHLLKFIKISEKCFQFFYSNSGLISGTRLSIFWKWYFFKSTKSNRKKISKR